MDSILPHLEPQISLPLIKILKPVNRDQTQQEEELRLRLLSRTCMFDQMRQENIPEDLFSEIEERSNKQFSHLTSKYPKILKMIDNKRISSINKEFVKEKSYLKDLHFSIENFTLLMRISRGLSDRGQLKKSLVLLHLLEVVFEDQILDKLTFYWAKVVAYLSLVLQKGTTSLGSRLNGSKKRFKKDFALLWAQIKQQNAAVSEFDVEGKKRITNLKITFLRLQVVQEYVLKKPMLLARNQDANEDALEKAKRKKSKQKGSRKNTKKSSAEIKIQEDSEPEERKDSEPTIEYKSDMQNKSYKAKNQKVGRCLSLILREIELANYEWKSTGMVNMLGNLFILESDPKSLNALKNMSQSVIYKAYLEIKFYLESQSYEMGDYLLINFVRELLENFDFSKAAELIQQVKSQVDQDWIFGNFKGEIVNKLLSLFVIVYNRIVIEVDFEFLEKVLGLNREAIQDVLKEAGVIKSEMAQIKEESRLDQMGELIKQLQKQLDSQ